MAAREFSSAIAEEINMKFPRVLVAVATLSVAIALSALFVALSAQSTTNIEANVDRVFAKWNQSTPGCAVGLSNKGRPVVLKAYGIADLEHDVKNTPDTIFEAGSVSKQFTAAAVMLLARDGKLSLDDSVRKYIPELPNHNDAITIRHMLTHTSGLRDWGSVASIAGWPRTTRVHTHAHVLDIAGRQSALNFAPGTRWSYSNTGYNLAAIIVSRVSGMPFAEFTRERIFQPIGMTRTSWRDDHTRIVKGRAVAYSERPDGFHIGMPFENVHGNGGLLTTVSDLLRWNEHFVSPAIADAAFIAEQQRPGRFGDGRAHNYALGLFIGSYKGLPEVSHGGATAAYRAFLTRYPEQHVSVAVLCNASSATAPQYAHAVADLHLADQLKVAPPPSSKYTLTTADLEALEGTYRNTETGVIFKLVRDQNNLRVEGGPALVAMSSSRFVAPNGPTLDIDSRGTGRITDPVGTVDNFERVKPDIPDVEQLRELVGLYLSNEAEASITVALEGTSLVLKRRPDAVVKLTPLYGDTFSSQIGTVIFRRDSAGRPIAFSVVQERVWDLRFTRAQTAN
jgi:CubicO group peptidase (beta-lactamase class C family)